MKSVIHNKILLVDDDPEVLESTSMLLNNEGYSVTPCSNAIEAINKFQGNGFDVVLTDIKMPEVSGIELLEKIHKINSQLPVILITAYADLNLAVEAISRGAFDFIIKPPTPDYLLHSVKKASQHTSLIRLKENYKRYLEDMVRQKTNELAQKNKELELILYVSSHDLRSPLVTIEGFSEEVSNSLKELMSIIHVENVPEEVKEKIASLVEKDIQVSLQYIQTSISKMDSMLSGLLKVSCLGQTKLKKNHLDMNRLMANILSTFEFQIKDKNVKLEVSKLPSCMADGPQINQVFSNLINNALKYLDPERQGIIKISGYKEEGQSVYCIEDSGIGIAPEHQEKIFEIFYQLNPAESPGEGLGLTIVHKVIEMHNGKVWVESEPGKGSKFYVSLPGEGMK